MKLRIASSAVVVLGSTKEPRKYRLKSLSLEFLSYHIILHGRRENCVEFTVFMIIRTLVVCMRYQPIEQALNGQKIVIYGDDSTKPDKVD